MVNDTLIKSTYNEAAFKMARINRCQEIIAVVNQDLFRWYDELGAYGYQIKHTELYNLKSEVWGKMGDNEKKSLLQSFKLYSELIKSRPAFVFVSVNSMSGSKRSRVLDKNNSELIEELLTHLQMDINVMLELAGYSTFTADDDAGDPYN